ncbi:hypothetical protein FXF59_21190 [Microbispora tritici]|uniref:Uncharacterized protein n=1 Tax=Microbispora tritici TaxID=2604471 RepID=A0ABY3LVG7_9ACTN|nr:hypothetical protein FXF59_21190 [Microbispora tritici]
MFLDTTVVSEVARGDMPLITMLLQLAQQGLCLMVPALVVAAAAAEVGGSDETGFLPAVRGIALLDHGAYGPLGDFDDALELGQAVARLTGGGRPLAQRWIRSRYRMRWPGSPFGCRKSCRSPQRLSTARHL